jgi:AraC-like DNA-binding protein
MDESVEKLDVSQLPLGSVWDVDLPTRPLAPWLRFTHTLRLTEADGHRNGPRRTLLDYELVLQLDGVSWIWSEPDGGHVELLPGSVAFIPPGFVHAWGSDAGTTIAVHFDLHARPELELPQNIRLLGPAPERSPQLSAMPGFALRAGDGTPALELRLVTTPSGFERWRERFEALTDLWNRRAARTVEGAVRTAEILGFALTTLADEGRAGRAHGRDRPDPRILELLRRLDGPLGASLGTRPTIPQLAALAHMGETSFRAAFARTMGCGPRRYLEQRRVDNAARALLETDRSVTEIARAAGYDDPYHFSRVFRRVRGVSPRAYRRGLVSTRDEQW